MKKRILSVLLCVAMLAGVSAVNTSAIAADNSDIVMAAEVLGSLGIITSNTDVEGVLEQKVSRAAFCDMLAKIMDISLTEKVYFDDISSQHWALASVNALVDAGIISAAADRKFNPDDYVTFEQACKIMLCAAGYGEYADINGGFPNGYISLAKRLGISDGVTTTGELYLADAIRILWNGINTPTYMGKRFGTDGSVVYTVDDETVLSIYQNLYMGRGRVTSIKGATLDGTLAEETEIYIDGIRFNKAAELSAADCFAKNVDFVYEKNGEAVSIVKAIDVLEKRNEFITITSDDLAGFSPSDYKLSYIREGGRSAAVSILRGATVLYNGKPYTGKLSSVIDELKDEKHRGTVTLIDSGNGCDTVIIESFRPFVVSVKDSKGIIHNQYNGTDKVDIGEEKTVSLYDANGGLYTNEVARDSVIMIAVSKDSEFVRAIVLGYEVSGNVDSTMNGGKKVIIDGKEYKVDKTFKDNTTEIKAGTTWQVAVDQFGYIVAGKPDQGTVSLKPGVLVDATYKTQAFGMDVMFKIFDVDGKMGIYSLADKVSIDGTSYTKEKYVDAVVKTPTLLPGAKVSGTQLEMEKRMLIRFRLDAEGKVKAVDTTYVGAGEDKGYTLSEIKTQFDYYNSSSNYNRYISNTLNGNIIDGYMPFSKTDTKIFSIPRVNEYGQLVVRKNSNHITTSNNGAYYSNSTDVVLKDENGNPKLPDDSMYKSNFTMTSNNTYIMDIYKWNADTAYADAIIVNADEASRDIKYYMVKGFSQALDENGEVVPVLDTHSGSFKVKAVISDIKIGDVVKLDKNAVTGMVQEVYKVFDAEKQSLTVFDAVTGRFAAGSSKPTWWLGAPSEPYDYYSTYQVTAGRVVDIKNGYIYIKWNNYENADKNLSGYDEVVPATIPITVYDKNAPNSDFEVYSGSISDLTTDKIGVGSTVVHAFFATSSESGLFVFK